jgi:ATP-dependent protease HslVU (ClpYQ) peptidase subunit
LLRQDLRRMVVNKSTYLVINGARDVVLRDAIFFTGSGRVGCFQKVLLTF